MKRVFLTIAGSDSIGGAGIQADIRCAVRMGFYPCSVITAVTAQNSGGVRDSFPLDSEIVESQLEAVLTDIRPDAVKIGVLPSVETVEIVANKIQKYELDNIVLDPVFKSSSDFEFSGKQIIGRMSDLLFPLVNLITPNRSEWVKIREIDPNIESRIKNVLITGGDRMNDECLDILKINGGAEEISFRHKKIFTPNHHGTGCVLSSAIACKLAKGLNMGTAVGEAIDFILNELKKNVDLEFGKYHYGPVLY